MKMIIDIPDNELKVPLRNIHLLISNEIVTEVCIKKYDKDKPYFMNLNYAPLEECEDTISRQVGRCKQCKWWKDSDGAYRRGIRAESKCPMNTQKVYEGDGYCYLYEPKMQEVEE